MCYIIKKITHMSIDSFIHLGFFLYNLPYNGYAGIFLYCLIGMTLWIPVGPDVFIFSSHWLGFNPFFFATFSFLGYLIALIIDYYIGKGIGVIIRGKLRERVEKFVNKYGKLSLFLAAITPIPLREVAVFCAASGFPLRLYLASLVAGLSLRFFGLAGLSLLIVRL